MNLLRTSSGQSARPTMAARVVEKFSLIRVAPVLGNAFGSAMRTRAALPWLTMMAGVFALLASSPAFVSIFEWQRSAPVFEVWRPLTGHFTHWSLDHLGWDLAIFGVFGGLLESRGRERFVAVLVSSGVGLGISLPILHPEMTAYRGLSGIDCALAAALAVAHLRSGSAWDRVIGAAILVFVLGKVGYELTAAQALFVDGAAAGFVSLPSAHAIGAVLGAAVGGLLEPVSDDASRSREIVESGWRADRPQATRSSATINR